MPQPSLRDTQSFEGLSAAFRVRVATTANVTIASALNPGDTLDGETLVEGDIILVKDQSTAAQNGVYVSAAIPFRHPLFSDQERGATAAYDRHPGRLFIAEEGSTYGDTVWLCTSDRGGSLGTTALAFAQQYPAATDSVPGILETATQAEQETGTAVDKIVTPGRQQFHPSAAKWWWYGSIEASPTTSASYNVSAVSQPAGPGTGYMDFSVGTDFSSANWAPFGVAFGEQRVVEFESIATGGGRVLRFRPSDGTAFNGAASIGGFGDQ